MKAVRLLWGLIPLILISINGYGAVNPHNLFTDNMVLQRGMPIPVYGKASSGENVTVTFNGESDSDTADSSGNWKVYLPSMSASGPNTMSIEGNTTVTLYNVMVGDVWVCSGQSNMEFFPNPQDQLPPDANHSDMRLFVIKDKKSTPQEDINISATWPVTSSENYWLDSHCASEEWLSANPTILEFFSIIGYWYGREIIEDQDVPVGLIMAAYAGQEVEQFMEGGSCYNGMIHPLTQFGIKGVIWWQGEGNCYDSDPSLYSGMLRDMIDFWRDQWDQNSFDFITVQLQAGVCGKSPWLRDAHFHTLLLPDAGMVVSADIAGRVHPRGPREQLGKRMASYAKGFTYGLSTQYSAPMYSSMQIESNKIRCYFDHVGTGLEFSSYTPPLEVTDGNNPWEIQKSDSSWVVADAEIDGNTVLVSASGVSNPVNVRYGFTRVPSLLLRNLEGLRASPFNSDTIPDIGQVHKATSPNPGNSSTGISTTADLSWTAGYGATSHDVYFGTDSTPDSGEFQGNQSGTSYDPGTLAYETTYYWQINEVNDTNGTTTGDIWSFTTEDAPSYKATDPNPANSATDVSVTADLSWTAGSGATSHDVYFGTSSPGDYKGNQTSNTYDTGTMDYNTPYYWRIDEVNSVSTTTGDVWSFTTEQEPPTHATNPNPSDGAENISTEVELTWTTGYLAESRDVYFGSDSNSVADANSSSPEFMGNQISNVFEVNGLNYLTTYYWRVDEVNDPCIWTGDVWSFTTEAGGAPGTIASDGFESGDGTGGTGWSDNWSFEGTVCEVSSENDPYAGTYHVDIRRDTGVATRTVDMSGVSNATLKFWWKAKSFETGETATVDVNDGTWHTVFTIVDGNDDDTYYYKEVDISGYNMISGFQIRGAAHMSGSEDYFWLDNIEITGSTGGPSLPGAATSPTPSDGATSVGVTTDLSWTAGSGATSHDVYFGTVSPGDSKGNQTATTYDTGTMEYDTMYYWRIDEVNASGTTTGSVWSFTTEQVSPPGQASNPSPANAATDVGVTTDLSWTAGSGATSHDVYFGTTSPGDSKGNQTDTTYDTGTMANDTTYYWRINEVNAGGTTTGSVWSFTTEAAPQPPGQASNPSPANGATSVSTTADLSWTAGSGATSHDVYFGTSSPGDSKGNQTATTYDTGTMANNTTYYWRIDEVNAAGTTTGAVWSFTTESGGVDPNLVGWWMLDEGSGTATSDSSGNDNDGILSGPAWSGDTNDGSDYSLDFEYSDGDLVSVSNSAELQISGDITIAAFVKLESYTPDLDCSVVQKGDGVGDYMLKVEPSGKVKLHLEPVGKLTGSTAMSLNTWYHIAGTWDGSTMKVYLNGSPDGSVGKTGTIDTSTDNLAIGGRPNDARHFDGKVDNVRVYNRVLSDEEIEELASGG